MVIPGSFPLNNPVRLDESSVNQKVLLPEPACLRVYLPQAQHASAEEEQSQEMQRLKAEAVQVRMLVAG